MTTLAERPTVGIQDKNGPEVKPKSALDYLRLQLRLENTDYRYKQNYPDARGITKDAFYEAMTSKQGSQEHLEAVIAVVGLYNLEQLTTRDTEIAEEAVGKLAVLESYVEQRLKIDRELHDLTEAVA